MKLQIVIYYVKTKEKQQLVKNKAGKQDGHKVMRVLLSLPCDLCK